MPAPAPTGDTNVPTSGGAGFGIETINVGPGAVGSGTEALRQVMVQGSPTIQTNVAEVDRHGQSLVESDTMTEETGRAILSELSLLRLAFCEAFGQLYLERTD